MERLDRVGRVDHLAYPWCEGEERNDVLPASSPCLADRRVTLAPFRFKLLEPLQSHVCVLGVINRLDRGQDRLAVLPGYEGKAVPDQMHDAGLNHRLGEDGRDRFRESFEAVDDGDQDVVDATQLQLVHHLEPEFGAFGLLDPKPQNVLVAGWIEPERDVDGLIFYHAFVADFDPQRVKKYHRI